MAMTLVGCTEIAKMIGVTRARANQLALTKGFPEPAHILAMGRIYRTSDVRKWAQANGREVKEPQPPSYYLNPDRR